MAAGDDDGDGKNALVQNTTSRGYDDDDRDGSLKIKNKIAIITLFNRIPIASRRVFRYQMTECMANKRDSRLGATTVFSGLRNGISVRATI